MLKRAQDMLELVQDGFKTTLRVVADLAESVGVPPAVTALIQPHGLVQPDNAADPWKIRETASARDVVRPEATQGVSFAAVTAPSTASTDDGAAARDDGAAGETEAGDNQLPADVAAKTYKVTMVGTDKVTMVGTDKATMVGKRRPITGDRDRSKGIRPLEVDDAIDGSTYLARIIWSLGVAELEGLGPLRPADIARMVMSRSAVSLEPPNVARYIRRSKPTTITIARTEGGSSFYQLNAQGQKLFRDTFALN